MATMQPSTSAKPRMFLDLPHEILLEVLDNLPGEDARALAACNSTLRYNLGPKVFTTASISLLCACEEVCEWYGDEEGYAIEPSAGRIHALLNNDSLSLCFRSCVKALSIDVTTMYLVEYRHLNGCDLPIEKMTDMFPNLQRLWVSVEQLSTMSFSALDRYRGAPPSVIEHTADIFRQLRASALKNSDLKLAITVDKGSTQPLTDLLADIPNIAELVIWAHDWDKRDADPVFLPTVFHSNASTLTKLYISGHVIGNIELGHTVDLDKLLDPISGTLPLQILHVKAALTIQIRNLRKLQNLREFSLAVNLKLTEKLKRLETPENPQVNIWEAFTLCGHKLKKIRFSTNSLSHHIWRDFLHFLSGLHTPEKLEEIGASIHFRRGDHGQWLYQYPPDWADARLDLWTFYRTVLPRFKGVKGYKDFRLEIRKGLRRGIHNYEERLPETPYDAQGLSDDEDDRSDLLDFWIR